MQPSRNGTSANDDEQDETKETKFFWRVYSSDLGRTKATTQLLLQNYDVYSNQMNENDTSLPQQYPDDPIHPDTYQVRYDHRLREIARGLRQGLPKEYTYEEATAVFNNGQHPLYSNNNANVTDATTNIPILETDDDAWHRIHALWLSEVMQDISTLPDRTSTTQQYNVLAVTHAALLRVFLQRLIGRDQLQQHPDVVYKYDNNDAGIPSNNRFHIPNTSYTILNVYFTPTPRKPSTSSSILGQQSHEYNDPGQAQSGSIDRATMIQRVDIERFTSTDHYQYLKK